MPVVMYPPLKYHSIYINIKKYIYVYLCICTYICICTHTRIYIYIFFFFHKVFIFSETISLIFHLCIFPFGDITKQIILPIYENLLLEIIELPCMVKSRVLLVNTCEKHK